MVLKLLWLKEVDVNYTYVHQALNTYEAIYVCIEANLKMKKYLVEF